MCAFKKLHRTKKRETTDLSLKGLIRYYNIKEIIG